MKNMLKRLAALLVCLTLALGSAPLALAEDTVLAVSFTGLTAQADGQWASEKLSGRFTAYQGGARIGDIITDGENNGVLTLPGSGNVTLVPVMEDMPAGYLVHESGYAIAVTEGRTNLAPLQVFADAGLFTLQAQGAYDFTLMDEMGVETMTFSTDENGWYALASAIPSGSYTLRMHGSTDAPVVLELEAYTGSEEQILQVQVDYVPVPTAETTAEPTAEPTAQPTAEPTPAATAKPVAIVTAAPTAEPTQAPTPVPQTGVLALQADGEAAYALHLGDVLVAEGQLTGDEAAVLDELAPGEYTITLMLPEGQAAATLNGYPLTAEGQTLEWLASVTAGSEGMYQIGLTDVCSISGSVNAEGAVVTASSNGLDVQTTVSGGAYVLEGLRPGAYQVTIALPQGDYVTEGWTQTSDEQGWTLTSQEQGVTASLAATLEQDMTLPAIHRTADAAVSGTVKNEDGSAMAGAAVTLINGSGDAAAQTSADENGAWSFTALEEGDYTVRVAASGDHAVADAHVALTPGQVVSGMQMSAGKPGSISVFAFADGNNNGYGGKYEKGLEGVTVSAVMNGDVTGTPVASAVTNRKGEATIENLAPGEYVLRAQLPSGYGFGAYGEMGRLTASVMQESDAQTQDSAAFTLEAGGEAKCGVGVMPLAVVSGYVWLDVNADGQRQDDEPGRAGCTIELVLRGGDTMYELVTGEDGNYVFGNVKPGEYNIRATTPEGLMFTKYTKYGGDKRSILTTEGVRKAAKLVDLKSGEVMDEQNIGLVTEAVLQVQCFLDANYNGLFDEGEQPLSGVEAELLKQGNGKTVVTKESGEDGLIIFDCLRANTYRLRALLPEGAAFTLVTDDPAGNKFQAREGRRENYVDDIVIQTGTLTTMVAGGVWPSSITGVCYMDDDFSADKDDKEKVVSGLTVNLLDASGNKVATDRTSIKGRYTFENVNPGTYTINLSAKKGYAFTKLGEGNIIVNTGDGTGESNAFDVTLGSSLENMDIGMILPGTVQGEVFADANDNGVKDADEAGLRGTVVRLMGEEGEWFSATVGEDGLFCFDAVMPGRYYLRYDLPERGAFAQVIQGGNTITGENGAGAGDWFDFKVGSTVNVPLCGALILGQVDGVAFLDPNANGVVDAEESLLSGVTLTLTPSRSDLQAVSVTTSSDGSFLLTNLHPDTYTLNVNYPEGLVMSRVDETALPVTAGQNTQSVQLDVAMGDIWSGQLLGGVTPAYLEGNIWLDVNNDGVWDETEPTPAGEQVEVIDQQTGSVFAVVTTGEDGAFDMAGLIPGMYTVRYALDSNTISAPDGHDDTFAEEDGALVMRDVQLISGQTTSGLKLGIVRYTNLGGQVWVDQGGSVAALSGAQVTLTDASGAEVTSIATGEDGMYAFGKLLPGQYQISVALPEGYVAVEPDDERITSGQQVSIMTACSGRHAKSSAIEVKMGEDQLALNIGAVLPGRLGDMAWLDVNGNGLQDTGESGVPGVRVELMRGGEVVAQTETDQYGYYRFTEVYPATYTLRVTVPAEVKPTRQRTDFPGIVSVLTESDEATVESAPVSVSSDRSNYNADLGFVLRNKDAYPAGYGEGATQDWTKIKVD